MEHNLIEAVNRLKFVYCKSMPKNPHYYVVKTEENADDYNTLFWAIVNGGRYERWYRKVFKYLYLNGYKYWVMSEDINVSKIINRAEAFDNVLQGQDSLGGSTGKSSFYF